MSISSSAFVTRPSSSFDISRQPLSIRHPARRKRPSPVAPIDRVRREFAEMRGLSPTLAQAARLFDLPTDECVRLLTRLVQDGSLSLGEDGRYRLRLNVRA